MATVGPVQAPRSNSRPPISAPSEARAFRVLRFDGIEPERQRIHDLLDLRPGRDSHERWLSVVDEMLGQLPRLMRPRGLFRVDEIATLRPDRVRLRSGAEFSGPIGRFLEHCTLIATFVVTIGSGAERLSRGQLRAGQVMRGTVGDAIASEATEAVAVRLEDEVEAWAQARSLAITIRYSPGYCGMSVEQQVPLFASLPAHLINVQLTPSCLMIPVKSISGLIGIGPADKLRPRGCPCELCSHPDCRQRRAAFDADRGVAHDWRPEE